MRPPRYYHDILNSQNDSTATPMDDSLEEVDLLDINSLIEVSIAMESQTFERNRAQAIVLLRLWGRLRKVAYPWEGVVIVLDQMAAEFERYKEEVDEQTGRCFKLKCDAISKALYEVACEVRKDRKIKHRSEWKMDMIYRCIGRLTLRGYDDSDDDATQRSIRNCDAVERALNSQFEAADWRLKDAVNARFQFWHRIYFAPPHCPCLQCVVVNSPALGFR